jgi:hypothetical protein
MIKLDLAGGLAAVSCLTCGLWLSSTEEARRCLQCGASHHPMCWDARGGCNHQSPGGPPALPGAVPPQSGPLLEAGPPALQAYAKQNALLARRFGILSILAAGTLGIVASSAQDSDTSRIALLLMRFIPSLLGIPALRYSILVGRAASRFFIEPALRNAATVGGVTGGIGLAVSIIVFLMTLG